LISKSHAFGLLALNDEILSIDSKSLQGISPAEVCLCGAPRKGTFELSLPARYCFGIMNSIARDLLAILHIVIMRTKFNTIGIELLQADDCCHNAVQLSRPSDWSTVTRPQRLASPPPPPPPPPPPESPPAAAAAAAATAPKRQVSRPLVVNGGSDGGGGAQANSATNGAAGTIALIKVARTVTTTTPADGLVSVGPAIPVRSYQVPPVRIICIFYVMTVWFSSQIGNKSTAPATDVSACTWVGSSHTDTDTQTQRHKHTNSLSRELTARDIPLSFFPLDR
jgi:hypothetical protein